MLFLQLARGLAQAGWGRWGRERHIICLECLLSSLVSCSSCENIQGFIEEFLQIFSSLLQEKR